MEELKYKVIKITNYKVTVDPAKITDYDLGRSDATNKENFIENSVRQFDSSPLRFMSIGLNNCLDIEVIDYPKQEIIIQDIDEDKTRKEVIRTFLESMDLTLNDQINMIDIYINHCIRGAIKKEKAVKSRKKLKGVKNGKA